MNFHALTSDGTAVGTGLREAEGPAVQGEEYLWDTPPVGNTAGIPVTERTALQYTALLAAFNVVATDVAVLPRNVYQQRPDGSRREAREHPVYRLLRRSPDGRTTPMKWTQALMGHALDHGNGFAEIQRRGRGTPHALHLLAPETTRAKVHEGRLGYEIEGGAKWLPAENVLHLAGLGYDGVSGYNFVRLAAQAIGIGLAGDTHAGDYFANGSDPGGVVETDKKLDGTARENFRAGWNRRHRGPGRRHGVAILEEGMKWRQTSSDPEKSQLVETRKFQVLDVIRPWRLPPHKVGDYSQAHLANLEASNIDYLQTALMGWITAIEQEWTLKLFSEREFDQGYYVEHNINALLRGDIKSRFEAYALALSNGWTNRDEVRRRENQDPIGAAAGGEKHTVQLAMTTLERVGIPEAETPRKARARRTTRTPARPPEDAS